MEDWRLNNQIDYLFEKVIQKKQYSFSSENDHEHCEFCWNKISIYPEDLHFGYYEPDSKSWICEDCFNDFKDLFKWSIKDTD